MSRKERFSLYQVFSTKYSLTLPATALSYIEQVLTEVCHFHDWADDRMKYRMTSGTRDSSSGLKSISKAKVSSSFGGG